MFFFYYWLYNNVKKRIYVKVVNIKFIIMFYYIFWYIYKNDKIVFFYI